MQGHVRRKRIGVHPYCNNNPVSVVSLKLYAQVFSNQTKVLEAKVLHNTRLRVLQEGMRSGSGHPIINMPAHKIVNVNSRGGSIKPVIIKESIIRLNIVMRSALSNL